MLVNQHLKTTKKFKLWRQILYVLILFWLPFSFTQSIAQSLLMSWQMQNIEASSTNLVITKQQNNSLEKNTSINTHCPDMAMDININTIDNFDDFNNVEMSHQCQCNGAVVAITNSVFPNILIQNNFIDYDFVLKSYQYYLTIIQPPPILFS